MADEGVKQEAIQFPKFGNGYARKLTGEELKVIQHLANLETIRINRFIPEVWYKHVPNKAGTGDETFEFEILEPGYIYVITSACLIDKDSTTTWSRFGFIRGATKYTIGGGVPAAAGDPVEWAGQVFCMEGDKLYGRFSGGAASDDLFIFIYGYKIKV